MTPGWTGGAGSGNDAGVIRRRGQRHRLAVSGLALILVAVTSVACTSTESDGGSRSGEPTSTVSSLPSASETGTGLILPDESSATVLAPGTSGASGAPSWPQAARLEWLARRHDDDGIRVTVPGGTHWQGRTPGEYAVLSSQGYQWFGADGSMVGCTATGACVGFAADGTVAITAGADQPAAVYDVRGNYVGNFRVGGQTTAPSQSPPDLADALAKSGVDVSALVDAGTARPPFAGGATGEPHLITTGGVRFTTQLTGQYVARGGDVAHAIQLQFDPMAHRRDVTLVGAVAIGAERDVIEVPMSGDVAVDGASQSPPATFEQINLDSGVAVGIWPRDSSRAVTVAVLWPAGETVVVTANPVLGITVVAHLPRNAAAVGLFGSGAASGASDLVGRSGISQDVAGIVTSWQVTRPELMFTSLVAPRPGFPETIATVPAGAVRAADAACRAAGVMQPEDRGACVFDVGLTGDDGFIAGHRLLSRPAEYRIPSTAAWSLWPALQPPAVGSQPLPAAGLIDVNLQGGQSVSYRVPLPEGGGVTLVHQRGCPSATPPGIDASATRLFDSAGHAVSPRLAPCGHQEITKLAPGTYTLVLSTSPGDPSTHIRAQVTATA
jgi:hypothetical protein